MSLKSLVDGRRKSLLGPVVGWGLAMGVWPVQDEHARIGIASWRGCWLALDATFGYCCKSEEVCASLQSPRGLVEELGKIWPLGGGAGGRRGQVGEYGMNMQELE